MVGLDGIHGPSVSITHIYLFICYPGPQLWHAGSLVATCGILFPDEGSNAGSLHCQCRVSATGPQEKSLTVLSNLKILQFLLLSKDTEHIEDLLSIHHFWLSHLRCQSCLYFSLLNSVPFLLISVMITIILILIQPNCSAASP